jgi:hypothetical protein
MHDPAVHRPSQIGVVAVAESTAGQRKLADLDLQTAAADLTECEDIPERRTEVDGIDGIH